MPPVRGVDHLVAEIDGHVEVGRIPFADAQIPAQADRVGITDEFGPELPCELARPLGVDRSVGVKGVGGQGDDPDRGEQDESEREGPGSRTPRIAEET